MIKIIKSYFEHKDDRGSIKGLINEGVWSEINLITSEANVTRGNHYHKNNTELFIILKGEISVFTQRVKNGMFYGEIDENTVRAGDVFIVEAMVNHTFVVKEDSTWINAMSEKIEKGKEDIHRVKN